MKLPEAEFIEGPERQLVALTGEFTLDTRDQIPALWNRFWQAQWQLPGELEQACFGASYGVLEDGRFSYAVGLHTSPVPEQLPENACVISLSAGRYAVFKFHGPVAEIPAVFDEIFGRWLPESGEVLRQAAPFERYPFDENSSIEKMRYEVWVPLQ